MNRKIEKPKSLKEAISCLEQFKEYCLRKPNKRNNEVRDTIIDCQNVLWGNFADIRKRDIQYETEDRETIKRIKKKSKLVKKPNKK